ncbi:MAG: response regulator [Polyangiaceae bacterium]
MSLAPRQALVLDDSRAMRMILRRILTELGFDVAEAANGREGLDRLRALERVELVLVDWNMPEMDGLEFVKAVRAEPAHDAVLLVMVTTESEMDKMTMALSAGANEYVMKPFDREIIQGKLELAGMSGF